MELTTLVRTKTCGTNYKVQTKVYRIIVYRLVWVVHTGTMEEWYRRDILVCRYAPSYNASVHRYGYVNTILTASRYIGTDQ